MPFEKYSLLNKPFVNDFAQVGLVFMLKSNIGWGESRTDTLSFTSKIHSARRSILNYPFSDCANLP